MIAVSQYTQAFLVFLTPLLISLTLIPYILRAAQKLKLFDHPDTHLKMNENIPRKIHMQPIPRLGGIAMVAGYYISLTLWSWPGDLWKVFIPALVIFFIGLRDDMKHLHPKIRLLLQLVVSAFTVYIAGLEFKQLIFTPSLIANIPYWVGFLLSVFILTGAINSINMVDGLDGLAGGLVLITATLLGYLYFIQTGNALVFIMITLPLAGSILGFLRYNTYPAQIFMGDGGSNWLGFMAGILILIVANTNELDKLNLKYPVSIHTALISVLLCMAMPILDTGFVITARLLKGKSPTTADKIHFHHGLLKIGLSHPNAVILIYFIALTIGITGFFPILFPIFSTWSIPYVVPIFLLALLYVVMKLEKDATEKIPLYQILFGKGKNKIDPGISNIFNFWFKLNQDTLFIILLAIPIFAGSQSKEIGMTAGIVFLLLLLSYVFQFWKNDFLDLLIISIGAIVLLIANNTHEVKVVFLHETYSIHNIYNGIFIFLSISTVLFLILTFRKQYLLTSPTDFLILILPLLLFLTPQPFNSEYNLTLISLRSLVLFISLMTAFKFDKKLIEKFRIVITVSLLYVFLTGAMGMKILY